MSDARVKVEHIVGECIVKAAHVILGARSVQPTRTPSRPTQKCWVRHFHLAKGTYALKEWNAGDLLDLARALKRPRVALAQDICLLFVQRGTPNTILCVQFNMDIDEVDSAVRELEPWRRNIALPLVIEVRQASERVQRNQILSLELHVEASLISGPPIGNCFECSPSTELTHSSGKLSH